MNRVGKNASDAIACVREPGADFAKSIFPESRYKRFIRRAGQRSDRAGDAFEVEVEIHHTSTPYVLISLIRVEYLLLKSVGLKPTGSIVHPIPYGNLL